MTFPSNCYEFTNDVEPSKVIDWNTFVIRRKWVAHTVVGASMQL